MFSIRKLWTLLGWSAKHSLVTQIRCFRLYSYRCSSLVTGITGCSVERLSIYSRQMSLFPIFRVAVPMVIMRCFDSGAARRDVVFAIVYDDVTVNISRVIVNDVFTTSRTSSRRRWLGTETLDDVVRTSSQVARRKPQRPPVVTRSTPSIPTR